jgi:arabinogalactan endo-1,4-beta-galactosidase
VEWVQVGNEVNSGMLHPLGKVSGNDAVNFVSFVNAGYRSVKEIYPDAKVIIHVSNGHDKDLFSWFFGLMKSHNARYDMIGMSLYPVWWENNGWTAWKPVVDNLVTNIENLTSKFGKPVMVCEVGLPVSEPEMAKDAIQYILDETRKIEGCHGIFMWEPQTDGVWKPESYNSLGWSAYDKGAFKDGKATIALDPFKE